MREKSKIKVGESVKVITGKYRNSNFVVKKVNRRRGVLFLENITRMMSVMNRREGKRQNKEVFSSIHISNVKSTKQ